MGIEELVNKGGPGPGVVDGVIARAPDSINDTCDVIIVGYDDDEIMVGGCPWMPRMASDGTPTLPSVDDSCAVAFSDSETPWIVAWWPGEVPSG